MDVTPADTQTRSFYGECFVQVNKEAQRHFVRSGAIISLPRYPSPGLCLVPYAALLPPIYSPLLLPLFFFLLPTLCSFLFLYSYCFHPLLPGYFLVHFSSIIICPNLNYLFTICLQSTLSWSTEGGRVRAWEKQSHIYIYAAPGWRLGRVQGRRYEVTTSNHTNVEQQTLALEGGRSRSWACQLFQRLFPAD